MLDALHLAPDGKSAITTRYRVTYGIWIAHNALRQRRWLERLSPR